MNDLEHYYTSIYDEADDYVLLRKALLVFFFLVLATSIYVDGEKLYIATLAIVLLQILVWVLKIKIDNLYHLAHNFQKYELLRNIFNEEIDVDEISDLKQKVSIKVSKEVKRKKQNNIDSVVYANISTSSEIDALKDKIHENSYFNHHLYGHTYDRNMKIVAVFFIITVIPILFFIPYIKIDPELSFPRLIFTLLSFSLIYEFFESTLKYKETLRVMKSIDSFLSSENKQNTCSITDLFSRYNEAKLITPNIPNSIYKKYQSRLNEGWHGRKNI